MHSTRSTTQHRLEKTSIINTEAACSHGPPLPLSLTVAFRLARASRPNKSLQTKIGCGDSRCLTDKKISSNEPSLACKGQPGRTIHTSYVVKYTCRNTRLVELIQNPCVYAAAAATAAAAGSQHQRAQEKHESIRHSHNEGFAGTPQKRFSGATLLQGLRVSVHGVGTYVLEGKSPAPCPLFVSAQVPTRLCFSSVQQSQLPPKSFERTGLYTCTRLVCGYINWWACQTADI